MYPMQGGFAMLRAYHTRQLNPYVFPPLAPFAMQMSFLRALKCALSLLYSQSLT